MKLLLSLLFMFITSITYSCPNDSLPPALENFINTEIAKECLSITCFDLWKNQQKKTEKYVVLDARENAKKLKNHIKGAKIIGHDPSSFTVKNVWHINRNRTIVVYSEDGIESKEAVQYLKGLGFYKIYNLLGGYKEWTRHLLPVTGVTK